jgi:ATP-dependent DNA ligase
MGVPWLAPSPRLWRRWRPVPDAVLDVELVVPDNVGLSDFEELRRRSLMKRLKIIQ